MLQTRTHLGFRNLLTRVYKRRGSLYFPESGITLPKHRNVLAVLGTPMGTKLIPAANIVTDAGDLFYAQGAAGEAQTNAFTTHYLGTAGTTGKAATFGSFTIVAGTAKVNAATYPRTADPDADNNGAGVDVVTHLANYAKADFTHADTVNPITHGVISIAAAVAGSPILCGYAFVDPFTKTENDTLKVFVNHEFLGI